MIFKFCPICGRELIPKEIGDEGLLPYCEKCRKPYFDWIGQAVIVAVVNEFDEVALLRQDYVSKTNWILVAGYIKEAETLEETTCREVLEEIGQKAESVEYISSYYYAGKELLMAGFLCSVKKREFRRSVEVDHVEWFSLVEAEKLLREGSIAQKLLIAVRSR
jgi:NAD+ diphosphatase